LSCLKKLSIEEEEEVVEVALDSNQDPCPLFYNKILEVVYLLGHENDSNSKTME